MKSFKKTFICIFLILSIVLNPIGGFNRKNKVNAFFPEIVMASPQGMSVLLLLIACGVVLSPSNVDSMYQGAVSAINATGEAITQLADGTVILTKKIRDAILNYVKTLKSEPVTVLDPTISKTFTNVTVLNTSNSDSMLDVGFIGMSLGDYVVEVTDNTGLIYPSAMVTTDYQPVNINSVASATYIYDSNQGIRTTTKFLLEVSANLMRWTSFHPSGGTFTNERTPSSGLYNIINYIKFRSRSQNVTGDVSISICPRVDYTGDLANVPNTINDINYQNPSFVNDGDISVIPKTLIPSDVIGKTVSDIPNIADVSVPDTTIPSNPPSEYPLPDTTRVLDFTPLQLAGQTLTTKFPFSVPFDLANSLKALSVSPKAPKFVINFDKDYFIGGTSIELDFSKFEEWAKIIRWGVMLLFTISLILISRRMIGGN